MRRKGNRQERSPAIVLLMFCFIGASGQSTDVIQCRIIDQQTSKAVSFATIRARTNIGMVGVFSNADGDFQIPDNYHDMADTLLISCIGYTTKKVVMSGLSRRELNTITLRQSVTELPGVTIENRRTTRLTAYRIVAAAITNIPHNYPAKPTTYVAYYRDYQLEDKQYVNLNEAIVNINDQGFTTNDQLQTRLQLYEYRKNQDFQRDTLTEMKYDEERRKKFIPGAALYSFGGNELSILRIHDAIRNRNIFSFSYADQFDKDFLKNHTFKLIETTLVNDTKLYHISFTSKDTKVDVMHKAKGELYIESGNYAIHKIDYSTFEMDRAGSRLLYNIQVEYAWSGASMQLNYISFNNFFKVANPFDFKVIDIILDRRINAFLVKFNNPPELKSALDIKNYRFSLDDKEIEIDRSEVSSIDYNQICLFLENPAPAESSIALAGRVKADCKNVRDTAGRLVNEVTFKEVNQFRELFVQKISDIPEVPADSTCINKNQSLSKSPIATNKSDTSFWMNSPLKH